MWQGDLPMSIAPVVCALSIVSFAKFWEYKSPMAALLWKILHWQIWYNEWSTPNWYKSPTKSCILWFTFLRSLQWVNASMWATEPLCLMWIGIPFIWNSSGDALQKVNCTLMKLFKCEVCGQSQDYLSRNNESQYTIGHVHYLWRPNLGLELSKCHVCLLRIWYYSITKLIFIQKIKCNCVAHWDTLDDSFVF